MIRGWGITQQDVWLTFVICSGMHRQTLYNCSVWAVVWLSVASWNLSSTDKQSWWMRKKAMKEINKRDVTTNY